MGSAWWLWLGFVVHGRPFQLIVIWLFHRNLLPTTAPERGVAELAPGHPLARVRVEHGFELHPALAALAPLEHQPEMAVARHGALAGPGSCRSPTHGSGDSASARWLASHPLRFPMASTVAISGASGKTGYRIAEEVQRRGDRARLLLRATSQPPDSLQGVDQWRLSLMDATALDAALEGVDALVIATGARPSVDLTGPMRVDAWGVQRQVESCLRVGVRRVVLVSSLCAGRWQHPLNLFGLILVWKRIGERALESSGLDWTIVRPGGLSEREENLDREGVLYTPADQQESNSIPRRLVARCCVDVLQTPESIGRILEVTSSMDQPVVGLQEALASW